MWQRIKHILIKEFIQMFRDPRMRVVMFVSPLFQVLLMSFAVSTDVKKVPTAVYDLDNTAESRRLIRDFTYSKYFAAKEYIATDEEQRSVIDHSAVNTVIRIPRGFSQDIAAGRTASVQLIVDGTDSNTTAIILHYAGRIVEGYSLAITRKRFGGFLTSAGNIPQVELRSRAWFNENLESNIFYVPGVVAMVVLIVTFILTAMTIVKEKEAGTIEQLVVSPIRPIELILGKLIPYAVVGIIDVFLITFVAVVALHVPVRGNLFLLFIASCLFLLTTLGLGLFVSTRSKTQQEALMMMFFIAQPMFLLSGFVFPVAAMPRVVQFLTVINPLKYFLVIIRGIFLKGSGVIVLWPHMLALLIIGVIIVTISALQFRKRLG